MGGYIICWGALRITNPKTLRHWIKTSKFQKELDNGWKFNVGCGRFSKSETCTCYKCRKKLRPKIQEIIDNFNQKE
jgi:hypothetical protein